MPTTMNTVSWGVDLKFHRKQLMQYVKNRPTYFFRLRFEEA